MMIIKTQTLSQKNCPSLPANSQQEEIENGNSLDALQEETSSTAPSASLTKLLEQTTDMPLVRLHLPTWLMLRKIAG